MAKTDENIALTETVYFVLLALLSPLHGYGIMKKIRELSDGRILMGSGTLYGALNTLVKKQWIETVKCETDSRKKLYLITSLGKTILINELDRLNNLIVVGNMLIYEEDK